MGSFFASSQPSYTGSPFSSSTGRMIGTTCSLAPQVKQVIIGPPSVISATVTNLSLLNPVPGDPVMGGLALDQCRYPSMLSPYTQLGGWFGNPVRRLRGKCPPTWRPAQRGS